MIEKNDNGKFFPPKKDPSCLFLPTADDSGRVHPGEFLFIEKRRKTPDFNPGI